jgi:hypothetical protein
MASGDAAEIILGVGRVIPTGLKPLGSSFFVRSGVLATAAHVTEGDDRQLHVFTAKAPRLNDYRTSAISSFEFTRPRCWTLTPSATSPSCV